MATALDYYLTAMTTTARALAAVKDLVPTLAPGAVDLSKISSDLPHRAEGNLGGPSADEGRVVLRYADTVDILWI